MKIPPPISYLSECFDCDSASGTLRWLHRPIEHFSSKRMWNIANANFAGKIAGSINRKGYRYIQFILNGEKQLVAAHRIVWAMTFGSWPLDEIDHINRDTGDNRIANLREATRTQNNINSLRKNKLGLRGVRARKGSFTAQISVAGKISCLGTYPTAEAAHEAYKLAAIQHHGAFARW